MSTARDRTSISRGETGREGAGAPEPWGASRRCLLQDSRSLLREVSRTLRGICQEKELQPRRWEFRDSGVCPPRDGDRLLRLVERARGQVEDLQEGMDTLQRMFPDSLQNGPAGPEVDPGPQGSAPTTRASALLLDLQARLHRMAQELERW